MRRFGIIISLIAMLVSCTSTEAFVSPEALSPDIPIAQKLAAVGAVELSVPMPEVFFDGERWMERMVELFSEADDYILLTTFLGSYSPELAPLYDALMAASERGVEVRFVMDGLSSFDMTESKSRMTPLYFLRESGIHLVEYNPVTVTHLMNPATLIKRDHRKMVIVDGEWAAVGGMNMNYVSIGADESLMQRDSMYLFRSPSLSEALRDEFVDIWNEASVEKVAAEDFPIAECTEGGFDAWLVGTSGIAGMYASLIGSAEESIILLPYLPALDGRMKSALAAAVDRGADLKITMPIDVRGYAASGILYDLPDLMESTGADVYCSVYDDDGDVLPLLHEKLMVVDSRYSVIGSANFNFRSMTLSEELALVIDSPELASILEAHVAGIDEGSVLVTLFDAERMKREDGSFLAYLFTYFGG